VQSEKSAALLLLATEARKVESKRLPADPYQEMTLAIERARAVRLLIAPRPFARDECRRPPQKVPKSNHGPSRRHNRSMRTGGRGRIIDGPLTTPA
jgi:hypothetical protein